jgi:hypothetical protein
LYKQNRDKKEETPWQQAQLAERNQARAKGDKQLH